MTRGTIVTVITASGEVALRCVRQVQRDAVWSGVHLAHNPFLQFFPLFATATSQSSQCLYKTKLLVYRLLIVLVQDEVVRKDAGAGTGVFQQPWVNNV